MAENRKLKIDFLNPDNKSGSMTVSYVNTESTNANLKSYATGLIALSDNSFISVTKVDEEKLD